MHYMQILRTLRQDADRAQTEIAEILGTSQTRHTRYERGASELPMRHLVVLCNYYHVSADTVLSIDFINNL